jgi:hypothetical protein
MVEAKEISLLKFLGEVSSLKGKATAFFRSWFFTKNYFELYYSDVKFIDLSFGIIISQEKWVYVPLTLFNEKLSFLGMPMRVLSEGFNQNELQDIVKIYLNKIQSKHIVKNLISFEQNLYPQKESQVEIDSFQWVMVDLKNDEEMIFKNISKGHKSSIKSGQKGLRIECFDRSNFNLDKFNLYREFYNRVTDVNKAENFWEAKKRILLNGEGFLLLGYIEEELGAASYFLNGDKDVYYGFGVYNRDLMKNGISLTHWPLYFSILESKKRDFENFVIGYIEKSEQSEKLNAIFDFKKRFTTEIYNEVFYAYSFLS